MAESKTLLCDENGGMRVVYWGGVLSFVKVYAQDLGEEPFKNDKIMSEMIEVMTPGAVRVTLLAGLIREREENAEQIGRYLLLHSDDLTPERKVSLEWHREELEASIREMKAEYGRIVNVKSLL